MGFFSSFSSENLPTGGNSLPLRYGQSAKGSRWMGEQFAQPFVDRRVTERFRELLTTGNAQLQVAWVWAHLGMGRNDWTVDCKSYKFQSIFVAPLDWGTHIPM